MAGRSGVRAILEAALAVYRDRDDPLGAALTLDRLGFVACDRGDRAGAAARFAASLPLWRQLGTQEPLAVWLAGVATLAATCGAPERATRLFGAAEALREHLGVILVPGLLPNYEVNMARLRAALGEAAFAAAWRAGRRMTPEDARAEAEQVGAGEEAPGSSAAAMASNEPEVLNRGDARGEP